MADLLWLAIEPAAKWIARKRLEANMRSLAGLAAYFEWQGENARRGLQDTHKRQAAVRAELNRYR